MVQASEKCCLNTLVTSKLRTGLAAALKYSEAFQLVGFNHSGSCSSTITKTQLWTKEDLPMQAPLPNIYIF